MLFNNVDFDSLVTFPNPTCDLVTLCGLSVLAAWVETEAAVAKCDDVLPSSKSASNPDPAPSTVLIAVKSCAGVWSAVAPTSIPANLPVLVAMSAALVAIPDALVAISLSLEDMLEAFVFAFVSTNPNAVSVA